MANSFPEPSLEHVADIQLHIGPVTTCTKPSLLGRYLYGAISTGTLTTTKATPPLTAALLPGASDYARILDDGSLILDIQGAFQDPTTKDLIRFTSTGRVAPGLKTEGRTFSTQFGELDAWQVVKFSTESELYGWLNEVPLVAQERIEVVEGKMTTAHLKVWRIVIKTVA